MTVFRLIEVVLLVIAGLLPIMNPFSTAPLLIALTAGMTAEERNRQTLLGCVYAFCILATFLVAGRFIISFFGISLEGIRIAGGLLVSTLGFRMVFPKAETGGEKVTAQKDIAFSPLAMPSLSGPGAISVVLATSAQIPNERIVLGNIVVMIGIAVTAFIAWLVLRGSIYLVRFLGPTGIDALTRIFGFLLICIGVQFVLIGATDYFVPLFTGAK
jgi:multiple antibiotic resistance protein